MDWKIKIMKYILLILLLFLFGCKSSENYKSFFTSKYKDQKLKLLIIPLINKNENGKLLSQYEDSGLVYKTKDSVEFKPLKNYLLKMSQISKFKMIDICFSNKFKLNEKTEELKINSNESIEIKRLNKIQDIYESYDIILYLNIRIWLKISSPIEINLPLNTNFDINSLEKPINNWINPEVENTIYDISFVYEETKTNKILFYRKREELAFDSNNLFNNYLNFYLLRDTPFFLGAYQDFKQKLK